MALRMQEIYLRMTSISTGRPLLSGKNLAGIEMLPTADDNANVRVPDRHPHRFSHQYQCLEARDLQEGRLTVVTAMCTMTGTFLPACAKRQGASFSSVAPKPCKLPCHIPVPISPILPFPTASQSTLPHHFISPVRIKVNVHNYYPDYNADFCKDTILHSAEV